MKTQKRRWVMFMLVALLLVAGSVPILPVAAEPGVDEVPAPIEKCVGCPPVQKLFRDPLEIPPLSDYELDAGVGLQSAGIWFMWDLYWIKVIGIQPHWGVCGRFGERYHSNILVKRRFEDSNQNALLNFHVGGRWNCWFIWESHTDAGVEVCYDRPDWEKTKSQVREMLRSTDTIPSWGLEWATYYVTYALITVIFIMLAF